MRRCVVRAALAATILLAYSATSIGVPIPSSIVLNDLTVPPPTTPQVFAIDLFVAPDGPSSIAIQGFQMELDLTGPDDGVTFSAAAGPQMHPYIFAPTSTAPLYAISNGGRSLTLGDFLDSGTGEVAAGTGLASLSLLVQPSAAGKSYSIAINTSQSASFLAVDSSTFAPFTAMGGTVVVAPEPTALTLVLILLPAGLLRRAGR